MHGIYAPVHQFRAVPYTSRANIWDARDVYTLYDFIHKDFKGDMYAFLYRG